LTKNEIKRAYNVLFIPPDKTREWNWYKQMLDLCLDFALRVKEANHCESDAIVLDIFKDMEQMNAIYKQKAWGWKAYLHKIWQNFLKDSKAQGIHPEYDISTKQWVWVDNGQAARLEGILEQFK
jgi:hypothetical protein